MVFDLFFCCVTVQTSYCFRAEFCAVTMGREGLGVSEEIPLVSSSIQARIVFVRVSVCGEYLEAS